MFNSHSGAGLKRDRGLYAVYIHSAGLMRDPDFIDIIARVCPVVLYVLGSTFGGACLAIDCPNCGLGLTASQFSYNYIQEAKNNRRIDQDA